MGYGANACRYYHLLNFTDLASPGGLKFLVKRKGEGICTLRERNSIITFLSYFEVPRVFLFIIFLMT